MAPSIETRPRGEIRRVEGPHPDSQLIETVASSGEKDLEVPRTSTQAEALPNTGTLISAAANPPSQPRFPNRLAQTFNAVYPAVIGFFKNLTDTDFETATLGPAREFLMAFFAKFHTPSVPSAA